MSTDLITCTKCRVPKPEEEMRPYRGTGKVRRGRLCLSCKKETHADWVKENPDYWKSKDPQRRKEANSKWMKTKYRFARHGTTKEAYDQQVGLQDGRCAICKEVCENLHIDHDHGCCVEYSCGQCLRGLLCSKCNQGIGLLQNNVENLKSAILYLEGDKIWQF